jgi:hypothetical protein
MNLDTVQLGITIGTVVASGVASFFAALMGVRVALAVVQTDIKWLKESRISRDEELNERLQRIENHIWHGNTVDSRRAGR